MIEKVASRVLDMMEDLIRDMEDAARQVSSGRALEDVEAGGRQLYLLQEEEGSCSAVVCVIEYDEYYRILDEASRDLGLLIDEHTRLRVQLPEAEFGENLVTGGFESFKGICVELQNMPLELLLDSVRRRLRDRGLSVACIPDEDLILCLPFRARGGA